MKKWMWKNKGLFIGAAAGAIAGFFYWKQVGCVTGTCAITSHPGRSMAYFALMGALLFNLFKKSDKQLQNDGVS